VLRDDHEKALEVMYSMLLPNQISEVKKLANKGMIASTAIITGPSGVGKTRTGLAAIAPFIGEVRVPKVQFDC